MKALTIAIILLYNLHMVGSALADEEVSPTLTSPDAVFDLGVHARSVALGAAGDVFGEDAMSVFQNPAALVNRRQFSVVATTRSQALGGDYSYANEDADLLAFAMSYNFKRGWGILGFGFLDYGVGGIPVLPEDGFTSTGEVFDDSQTGLVVSYAKPFDGDRVSVGVTFRYLRHKLYEATGDGHGFDLGMRYRFTETWYGGVLIRDGVDMDWSTHEEPGVSAIKYSLAGRFWGGGHAPMWCMTSATQKSKQPIVVSIGLEQRFLLGGGGLLDGVYYLRASLGNAYAEERNFGRHDGLNAGEIGFGVGVAKRGVVPGGELVFDYAYRLGEVWDENYFTVGVRVGGSGRD